LDVTAYFWFVSLIFNRFFGNFPHFCSSEKISSFQHLILHVLFQSILQITYRLWFAWVLQTLYHWINKKKSNQAFLSPLVERLTSYQSLYLSASLNDNVNLRPVLIARNPSPHSEEHGRSASPSVFSSRNPMLLRIRPIHLRNPVSPLCLPRYRIPYTSYEYKIFQAPGVKEHRQFIIKELILTVHCEPELPFLWNTEEYTGVDTITKDSRGLIETSPAESFSGLSPNNCKRKFFAWSQYLIRPNQNNNYMYRPCQRRYYWNITLNMYHIFLVCTYYVLSVNIINNEINFLKRIF